MLRREGLEWTVAKLNSAIAVRARLEAAITQDLHQCGASGGPALRANARRNRAGSRAACFSSRREHRAATTARTIDARREDPRSDVVAPRRKRDVDRPIDRAAIELGRPSGARTRSTGAAPERRLEQPALDQSIEMKRGERATDSGCGRSLVPVDGLRGGRRVLVDPPTDRLGEQRHLVDRIGIGSFGFLHGAQPRSCRGCVDLF